jgi:uncharacterized coiled-coil protein SlyX
MSKYEIRTEIVEGLGPLESESDTDLKLQSQLNALEERLIDFENIFAAQKIQIGDLHAYLSESNRNIRNLEIRNNHMEVALTVLGILFISSIILVHYMSQGYDLFGSYN